MHVLQNINQHEIKWLVWLLIERPKVKCDGREVTHVSTRTTITLDLTRVSVERCKSDLSIHTTQHKFSLSTKFKFKFKTSFVFLFHFEKLTIYFYNYK